MSTMVIDGKPATARSGATVEIRDPATGELVDKVPQAGVEETRQAVDAAHKAFRAWADMLPHQRFQILMKGAALARQHLDEVASLLTREQGKPLRDSKIEAQRYVENIEFYAAIVASGAIRCTGETQTGKQVMSEAASDLKHVTLELGGSDPAIVCDDADIEMAGKAIAIGRFFNCGQACLAVKRVFVHEAVADQLIEKVTARAKRLKVAPGSDASAQMGPMHSAGGREEIEAQLKDAVDRGARVLAGGNRLRGEPFDRGFFFEPTVITDVPPDARVWREETFGPLLPIARVKSLDEAIERANDSEFGLGSSVFTRDIKKAQQTIDRLDVGYSWINQVNLVAYDELPFGGTKHSGFGKEHGVEVLDFYTEEKSVIMGGV